MSLGHDCDMALLSPRHHTNDDNRFSKPSWLEEEHPDFCPCPSHRRRQRRNNHNRTMGMASRPVHASGQANGADSLTRDLSGVSLALETMTATHVSPPISPSAPPPAIREVGSTSRPLPFGMSDIAASYPTLTSEHVDSEEGDDLDLGLDFSGLCDPKLMRHFLYVCDYFISDDSND